MNTNTILIFIFLLLVVYANYSARIKSHQIYCTFRRRDRTKLEKWAKDTQGVIMFDKGWYDVEPQSTVLKLFTGGIHSLFPIWIRCLDYRFDSPKPLNDKFENVYTPEQREQLSIADDVRQFGEGNAQALSGKVKQGLLERLMPIIVIGGFAIVGFLIYRMQQNVDMLGNGQNVIESMLGQLLKR